MKDVLTYKEFIGSVHFSDTDRVFHGKIEGIDDLVTFEGQSVDELTSAFREAADDYIALCKETSKEPLKSCKGSFNIRIPSDLHIKAIQKAAILGLSLNQLVQGAIEEAVDPLKKTIPKVHLKRNLTKKRNRLGTHTKKKSLHAVKSIKRAKPLRSNDKKNKVA
jgi:predicted HicB family RNase H-like nuclease